MAPDAGAPIPAGIFTEPLLGETLQHFRAMNPGHHGEAPGP